MRRRWCPSTFQASWTGSIRTRSALCWVCSDPVLDSQRVHVGVGADVLTGQHQWGAAAFAQVA